MGREVFDIGTLKDFGSIIPQSVARSTKRRLWNYRIVKPDQGANAGQGHRQKYPDLVVAHGIQHHGHELFARSHLECVLRLRSQHLFDRCSFVRRSPRTDIDTPSVQIEDQFPARRLIFGQDAGNGLHARHSFEKQEVPGRLKAVYRQIWGLTAGDRLFD